MNELCDSIIWSIKNKHEMGKYGKNGRKMFDDNKKYFEDVMNKVIKNNGFVFFSKNNRKKTNKKRKILEKQGGLTSGLVDDGQFEFDFVNLS
jgi:hypothetical protein